MNLNAHRFVREPLQAYPEELTEQTCPECFEPTRRCRCPDDLAEYRGAFETEGRH